MKLLAMTLLSVLAGCQTQRGFDHKMSDAYSLQKELLRQANGAYDAHTLAYAEALNAVIQAGSTKSLLDAAGAAQAAGNSKLARNDLSLSLGTLRGVQDYLRKASGK